MTAHANERGAAIFLVGFAAVVGSGLWDPFPTRWPGRGLSSVKTAKATIWMASQSTRTRTAPAIEAAKYLSPSRASTNLANCVGAIASGLVLYRIALDT